MVDRSKNTSPRRVSFVAGIAYLIIIIAGIVAEFFIRSSMIVSGDASATAHNILDSESLFRLSVGMDLVMIGADLVVAMALYVLLRPINRTLALAAAFCRLVMDAILGLNLLNLLAALMLLDGSVNLSAFDIAQREAGALLLIDAHALGYSIGLIPFGFGTLIIGYLLFTSRYVPRFVSVLLLLAALVYLTGSFIDILAPGSTETFAPAYAIPVVAETLLALWLVFKGVRVEAGERQAMTSTATAGSTAMQAEAGRAIAQ